MGQKTSKAHNFIEDHHDGRHIVGRGTAGYVITPAFRCNLFNADHKTIVGKLFTNKRFAKIEYANHNHIQQEIDKDGSFTVKMHHKCDFDSPLPNVDGKPACCQIVYDYGGVSLTALIIKKNVAFDDLIPLWLPLFHGLHSMGLKKTVHMDIKLDNILYDEKREKLVLIDFGLMLIDQDAFNEDIDRFFESTSMYISPEIKFLEAVLKIEKENVKSGDVLGEMRNFYQQKYRPFGKESAKLWHGELEDTLNYYSSEEARQDNILNLIMEKFDIYSLGVTILWLYRNLPSNNVIRSKNFIESVIMPMIHFSVKCRSSPLDALVAIQAFVRAERVVPRQASLHALMI